ncbi:BamA/TamA family outer membrane protein [Vibrio methylphosphonaticus]|uniref:BamA/TamA family outer membrane protein n=1 Tax=Vibrio methylphosphonaticus TaxID=2946866 RepID=UPI002029C70B|nr:BamA/TamA family outer membrane protein [Vibrio methylphosphonaticus]MCL9774743.1 BamA/TamA family outer membrane protein [Vibrio methylphosphonaticus]
MRALSSVVLVTLLISTASAQANETIVIPSYAQLAIDKASIGFEPDLATAEKTVESYDQAVARLKDEPDSDRFNGTITDLKYGKKNYQEINGMPMFSFLGGPAYTPEQGLLVAVGGLYSFKTNREQEQLQRSSVSMFVIGNYVDSEVGYGLRARHSLFWNNNDIQFQGTLNAGTQSEHYWGVGYDNAEDFEFGDITQYKATVTNYEGTLTFRIHDNWFAGPALRVNYFNPTTVPDSALLDDNFEQFKDKPFTWGVGAALQYDSRDVAVNAWRGSFFKTEALTYSEALGSQADYQKLDVEYRYYYSVQEGRVIALLSQYQQAFGDVPYYDMPELGGANSMRGYYQGQYRDRVTAEVTAEYRHTFRRHGGGLSAHGMTLWSGVGAIGNSAEDLSGHAILSYGVGYRYELQPRMNIRLDLGMGKHGSAFYFNFTEAF